MSERRRVADPEPEIPGSQRRIERISTPHTTTPAAPRATLSAVPSAETYRHLLQSDLVGVILGEPGGSIIDANDAFLALTGYTRADLPLSSDATPFPVMSLLSDGDDDAVPRKRQATSWETEIVAEDGSKIPVLVSTARLSKTGREYIAFVMDLSQTKEGEIALRRSEERFKALYDQSPSISVTVDPTGSIVSINSLGAEQLGYRHSDLLGAPARELLHQEDRAAFQDQLETTSSKPGVIKSRDFRFIQKDGSTLWVRGSCRSMLDTDGQVLVLLVCKDLTEQKENEAKLLDYQTQLRALTLELGLAEEQERRRIAVGLHDSIGHSLALASMKLSAYGQSPERDPDSELVEVRTLIDDAIQATRALTFELSSPVLYELGLEAALLSIGEHVVEANGLRFVFDTDGQLKPLSTDARIVLYRSVRELLLNVMKHAAARSVTITVARVRNRIEITVADDGVGIDAAAIVRHGGPRRGFGLFSIEEQLRAIGGDIVVDTTPGRGTKCLLVAPLESPAP